MTYQLKQATAWFDFAACATHPPTLVKRFLGFITILSRFLSAIPTLHMVFEFQPPGLDLATLLYVTRRSNRWALAFPFAKRNLGLLCAFSRPNWRHYDEKLAVLTQCAYYVYQTPWLWQAGMNRNLFPVCRIVTGSLSYQEQDKDGQPSPVSIDRYKY